MQRDEQGFKIQTKQKKKSRVLHKFYIFILIEATKALKQGLYNLDVQAKTPCFESGVVSFEIQNPPLKSTSDHVKTDWSFNTSLRSSPANHSQLLTNGNTVNNDRRSSKLANKEVSRPSSHLHQRLGIRQEEP
jgi:hypothetical protein